MVDIRNIADVIDELNADDEKQLERALARLVQEYGLFVNDEKISVEARVGAIENLTGKARQIRKALVEGSSIQDALGIALGDGSGSSGVAGMLDMPNRDIAEELNVYARQQLGSVDVVTARGRVIVAKSIIDGTTEIAGDQVRAVTELSDALDASAAAEADKEVAEAKLEKVKNAIVTKDLHPTRMGSVEQYFTIDVSQLSPELRQELGI